MTRRRMEMNRNGGGIRHTDTQRSSLFWFFRMLSWQTAMHQLAGVAVVRLPGALCTDAFGV